MGCSKAWLPSVAFSGENDIDLDTRRKVTRASPSRHYSAHHRVEEEDDPGTPGKGPGERNVDGGLQVQLEEDGGGSSRQSWMESSGVWPMLH